MPCCIKRDQQHSQSSAESLHQAAHRTPITGGGNSKKQQRLSPTQDSFSSLHARDLVEARGLSRTHPNSFSVLLQKRRLQRTDPEHSRDKFTQPQENFPNFRLLPAPTQPAQPTTRCRNYSRWPCTLPARGGARAASPRSAGGDTQSPTGRAGASQHPGWIPAPLRGWGGRAGFLPPPLP